MDKLSAKKIAQDFLDNLEPAPSDGRVIMDDVTIEKSYGWVFIYQSKTFVKTGHPFDAYGGNSPVFVDRNTGEIILLGTSDSIEMSLRQLEKEKGWDK